MVKMKYTGCSDTQAAIGRSHDPRPHLTVGSTYVVEKKEVHSWQTLFFLTGFMDTPFNSVCFEQC